MLTYGARQADSCHLHVFALLLCQCLAGFPVLALSAFTVVVAAVCCVAHLRGVVVCIDGCLRFRVSLNSLMARLVLEVVAGLSCRQRVAIVFLDTDAWVFVSGAPSLFPFAGSLPFCSVLCVAPVFSVQVCLYACFELSHYCVLPHGMNSGLPPLHSVFGMLACVWHCELTCILPLGPHASRMVNFCCVCSHSLVCCHQCVAGCMVFALVLHELFTR